MVHCDWRVNHHIRVLLDETFGADSFRNEIIWHYRRWTANQTSLQRLHQTIWYYARSPSHETDVPMVEYSPTTNLDQIWQARTRNEDNIAVYDRDASGTRNSGAKRGVPMGDVWDMPYLNPKATERVGYPTQKPVHLLERLISLSTGPGDLVVDPCCGSGTTLVAAELLDRRWIGIDANPDAIALSRERTRAPHKSVSRVLADGREGFVASTPNGVEATLDLLGAHRVQRNAVIHGYLSPSGLRALGIPDSWSVPVYIEPAVAGPSCQQLPQFVRAMRRKQADLGLYLTSQMPDPPTKAPRGAVVAKVPATEQDLRMLRLQLQRLPLPTPQREHQTS